VFRVDSRPSLCIPSALCGKFSRRRGTFRTQKSPEALRPHGCAPPTGWGAMRERSSHRPTEHVNASPGSRIGKAPAPEYSTGWGQDVEEAGPKPERVGPGMEGTSGAADRASLRGETREAALVARSARAGLAGRARRRHFVYGEPSGDAGHSGLRRSGFATGGVRADRVGAKLSPRAIAAGGAESGESLAKAPDP